MEKNNALPYTIHTVIDENIDAQSVSELYNKLAALHLTDKATVHIQAKVSAINQEDVNPVMAENFHKKNNTIRLLRRQVRRLKSELKSKDRAMFAQKEFYECMLDEVQKKQKKSDQDIEKWFSEMVLKTIKQLK